MTLHIPGSTFLGVSFYFVLLVKGSILPGIDVPKFLFAN